MANERRVWALLGDEETQLIERAAKKERRSRAGFIAFSALERAVKILEGEGSQ